MRNEGAKVVDDGVELSLQQFVGAWQVMCGGTPGYRADTGGGIDFVFAGVPVAFFNVALLTARGLSTTALQEYGRQACAWAAGPDVPWLFVVTHETLEPGVDAEAALGDCGLAAVMPMTGMLASQVLPSPRLPQDLQLTIPEDVASCEALLDVNAAAYGMDLEAGKSVIGTPAFWKDHVVMLGRCGGKPASTCAVIMVDGYRYVALVATDPGHQRRGYADATMRRSLEEAARVHGERPTVLHATAAGRPVYERMGYQPISTHTAFMEKRFLEGH
jgi:GNAT superfamily N-acetyltransferase